ncbi:MAG: cob(I)yrinic acid a,c-diamide adenosyltransferase [Candidatus Aenigmatarchaeota archaeon]
MKPNVGSGDEGKTSLIGKRVWKDDLVVEILGKLDELNCFLGFARSKISDEHVKELIEEIQKKIFVIGGVIAGSNENISKDDVSFLEKFMGEFEKKLKPIHSFVLPTGEESCIVHICRVKCREVERCLVKLHRKKKLNKSILAFINRLSDLLFMIARFIEES